MVYMSLQLVYVLVFVLIFWLQKCTYMNHIKRMYEFTSEKFDNRCVQLQTRAASE